MPEHLHKRKHLTSFQLIILGFAGVILIGALILTLPVSSASGVVTPFDTGLFLDRQLFWHLYRLEVWE